MSEEKQAQASEEQGPSRDEGDLTELLTETRILLPSTQVLAGFLTSLPFTPRFHELEGHQRGAYFIAFLTSVIALLLLTGVAAYHRIARPIREKDRFKNYASRVVVAALFPIGVSSTASTYLVLSMVDGTLSATLVSVLLLLLAITVWWVAPKLRVHERAAKE